MHQIKSRSAKRKCAARVATGQAISEFGATIAVLVCLILIPILSFAFVPIRYSMAQGVTQELVNRLAHAETRGDAYKIMSGDQRWVKSLAACGAQVTSATLVLVATSKQSGGNQLIIQRGQQLPKDWLPNGKLAPCIYSLRLTCDCLVAPLFGAGGGIKGINSPVPLTISSSAHWENLSRDPKSANLLYCIDE